MLFVTPTGESRFAGDEGLYAAIRAAQLARALHGATIRAHVSSNQPINPNSIPLALPPAKWVIPSTAERAMREVLSSISGADAAAVAGYGLQVPVALPDEGQLEALRVVLPYIHHLKPHPVMTFDDVQRLERLMTLYNSNVTCLNLGDGAVMPHNHAEAPPSTVVAKINELMQRFPLPAPKPAKGSDDGTEDTEEEEMEDETDYSINEELMAWCQSQEVQYTTYDDAIRQRAAYELDAFRNICKILMNDTKIRVLLLDHNQLCAPNEDERVSLVPLRMLAKVIDANETIKVLDLSSNMLGPFGFGVIAKALTKNISIVALDLSDNQLGTPSPDTDEDPEHQPDDPVFGEEYSGLEAISEVLKKNKFLRCLRLAHNDIHSGGEGEEAPPVEVNELDPENDATTVDVESWQDLPLWHLMGPLRHYHRLRVLDLSGNLLGPVGAHMVATALAENHSVEVLDLTDNGIGFHGLHYISKVLLSSQKTVLNTLILRRNQLAGKKTSKAQQKMALAAMQATAAALRENGRLRRLSVAGNYLGTTLASALLSTIATVSSLEELDLESNDICGDVAAPHDTTALGFVAAALYSTAMCNRRPTLRVLNLANNNIRSSGLNVLFPSAASMPISLVDVNLSRNNIDNAVDALTHLMISSPVLQRLTLAHNAITDASVVVPGVSSNTYLAELDLSHNLLGSRKPQYCEDPQAQMKNVERLVDVFNNHPSLEDVNLSFNDFEDVHGPILARLCEDHGSKGKLRRINLCGNHEIKQCDINNMVRALPQKSGIEVFYISSTYPATTTSGGVIFPVGRDAALDAPTDRQQQQIPLLKLMHETVHQCPSLLDINCDLQRSAMKSEESADGDAGADVGGRTVEEIKQCLLLNALMAPQV
ncbi:leucine-rich repeat protein (LRRP), putative [Trypanosoma equiperdum]|uniref:Leucine-rich repeat protein (LRRP) n=2 Tax=Trypanozoon TaxID=39700 RepID=Q385D2_TRYB2|nr:hypothetical protein, conserved [Trypanosoma brucei brucei TREU927]EAN79599.1 hypothetical protein, conserved [Trypanosoma brucei brucei TREU927]SCU70739.1 leucine-rich repeat protein (LRRP), putative [Trypanosoma equiperdum]